VAAAAIAAMRAAALLRLSNISLLMILLQLLLAITDPARLICRLYLKKKKKGLWTHHGCCYWKCHGKASIESCGTSTRYELISYLLSIFLSLSIVVVGGVKK
jgi:hypothetical protein